MIWTRLFAAVLALVLVAPLSGCGKTISDTVDDAEITTQVKTAFVNDAGKLLRIDVDTVKRVVTLSGRVDTKEEETRAIALARKVKGVADVKSTLVIGPDR